MSANLKVNSRFGAIARVALDVPIAPWFDYRIPAELDERIQPGVWVVVPWGRGRRVGVVLSRAESTQVPEAKLRTLDALLEDAPIAPAPWLSLLEFAATYYHRGVGELGLLAVPKALRTPPSARSRKTAFARAAGAHAAARVQPAVPPATSEIPDASGLATEGLTAGQSKTAAAHGTALAYTLGVVPFKRELNADQQQALETLRGSRGFSVTLLHGVTGSGKTEVYLSWLEAVLQADPSAQALMLVPEIALTPQLARQVAERFPEIETAILHSDIPDAQRARAWFAAASGCARLVVGTRLAVLTPMPRLAAIVVDEEHDGSYRQQDGVSYSARDLAIAAARAAHAPVLLGSATPSLETWRSARHGRYRLLKLPARISGASVPRLELIDTRSTRLRAGLAPAALGALEQTVARGEQALIFINRRGYAPVLGCDACAWVSGCEHCSAWRVLHRQTQQIPRRYQLICHHCGSQTEVPRACPQCGSIGLSGLGRGTQRLEEELLECLPGARIARLDRDVARRRGAAQAVITAVHEGDVDLLVGTQMLAKGHDFRRLSLVVVADGDAGLFSADYRATERLFATLMQVSGRAGRDIAQSQVLVQTRHAEHSLFAYLQAHDFEGFADALLAERLDAGMPPFSHHALLRADAEQLKDALHWLDQAKAQGEQCLRSSGSEPGESAENTPIPDLSNVRIFDPVPMPMARLMGRERAQLLVESSQRASLHAFVQRWLEHLRAVRAPVRWHLEIDPGEI